MYDSLLSFNLYIFAHAYSYGNATVQLPKYLKYRQPVFFAPNTVYNMARLKNLTQMTGSMAKISMYTRQGSDDVIIRTKGGPSKRQIKTRPEFATVRLNNSEWAGCIKMSKQLRWAFKEMNTLEDYNVSAALNALAKHIQKMDTDHPQGQRSIRLSHYTDLLTGLNFSQKQSLEAAFRVTATCSIDRETGRATIGIPAIDTAIHLSNQRTLPYFRIKASLGGVSDVTFSEELKRYDLPDDHFLYASKGQYCSDWLPTTGTIAANTITLQYPMEINPIPAPVTLILCLGIEYGNNRFGNLVEPIKYSGAGKVVKCG